MKSTYPNPPIPPLIAMTVGILAVSTASVFIRQAQIYAPSLVIAAYRLVLASLVLAPIALRYKRSEIYRFTRFELSLALVSGFLLALHFAAWITSLEYTTVTSSVVLVTTSPLWVALLSPLVLKEPLTWPIILGMGLALVGSVVVGLSDACAWVETGLLCPSWEDFIQGKALYGDGLALIGAWMATGYLLIGRRLRARMSLISYVFVVYGVAGLILVVIMVTNRQSPVGYPPVTYLWFILLALVPQLVGHSTFNWALGYLSAAFVSIALLGEPIGSTILALIFLNERPTAFKLFGAILILAGIYVATQGESRRKTRQVELLREIPQ